MSAENTLAVAELNRAVTSQLPYHHSLAFVSHGLWERGHIAVYEHLKNEGRFMTSWDALVMAGIPNFLAFGRWVVPEEFCVRALMAVQ